MGSITSVSKIPKVTPFITEWAHKEMFTWSVADIITTKSVVILSYNILRVQNKVVSYSLKVQTLLQINHWLPYKKVQ